MVLNLDVTTGSIDFTISSPLTLTSYDIYLDADLGDIDFPSKEPQSVSNVEFQHLSEPAAKPETKNIDMLMGRSLSHLRMNRNRHAIRIRTT